MTELNPLGYKLLVKKLQDKILEQATLIQRLEDATQQQKHQAAEWQELQAKLFALEAEVARLQKPKKPKQETPDA